MKNIYIKIASFSAIVVFACIAVANAQVINTNIVLATSSMPLDVSSASVQIMFSPSAATTCPAVIGFMKLGAPNKPAEVVKMQSFLKIQGFDVDVTGIFDVKTEDAVKAFQRAHMDEVMAPWGATRPSGIVYITTAKKANQIACGAPLTLDPTELSTVADYRRAAEAAESQQAVIVEPGMSAALNADDPAFQDQTAAAGSSSIFGRFMRFLRNAF
jgi:hypothetical protein